MRVTDKIACNKNAEEIIGKTDYDAWTAELAEIYRKDDMAVIKSKKQNRQKNQCCSDNILVSKAK